MKTFDLTNTDDNGQMIIHLQGDNANYTVTYDNGEMVFENVGYKYVIPAGKGDALRFYTPDRSTGEWKYDLTDVRTLHRDTTPTDFGISDILDVTPSSTHFTEEITLGGINHDVAVIAPEGVSIYVNSNPVASGTLVTDGDVVKFEITAPAVSGTSEDVIMSIGDISKTVSISSLIASGSEIFTTPGTFNWLCPNGVSSIDAIVIGGGGAGGKYTAGAGGGAATGTYTVTPGQTYSITVGAGGLGNRIDGTDGGNSVFASFASATGGEGGQGISLNESFKSNGGVGSGGQINGTGGYGTSYANVPGVNPGGNGTNGAAGGGGGGADNGDANNGGNGSGFAGGGGGGGSDNGDGGDGGTGGIDGGYGGGGGATDGTHLADNPPKTGGTGGLPEGQNGEARLDAHGGDGGGPTGGAGGQGFSQQVGGGGGGSFGGGGGSAGHANNATSGFGGGGLVRLSWG